MEQETFDGKDALCSSGDPSSSEAIGDDPILESKHKIFLSHSGAQKEFVAHLCKALEERCHYPFFDRRPESLPKGKKFPDLIFKAAQHCQLFVVVVSEEYFMSKWPLVELSAFVKATKKMKSSMNQGILPLFYGLSASELKDEKRRQRWFETWETFAREDSQARVKVDDWKYALDELTKFNGLPYNRELKQVVEYENEIVSHICKLLPPDIKWEDSHVQGNAHEVVIEKMKQVGASQLAQVKVVGLYGVGGIGKTTVCKTLCNELSHDFEGRVCHIELNNTSSSSKELLHKVLIKLTRKSVEVVQQLDEGECKDVLFKNLTKQKTFLAIDNVWDNAKSINQALVFLKAPSHPQSFVLVTSRAQKTLEHLGVNESACLEMPELGQENARNLFLYHVANGQQFTSEEDMRCINLCVKRCYFSKGGGRGFHYHPLALEALGRQLRCHGKNPLEWEQVLSLVWNFNAFSGENEVFGVLRSSFDLLRPIEQDLFMDVSIFLQRFFEQFLVDQHMMKWSERLCSQYKRNMQEMQKLLDSLKGKGLLQDVDLSLGKINMHDLYSEFALLEAKGKLVEATGIGNRRWVFVDVCDEDLSELEVTPAGGCWQNLTRLSIRQNVGQPIAYPIKSLAGVEWQYFSNVLVLQFYGLKTIEGTLNLKGMKCLRSLQIYDLVSVERLEGLEGLTNLTYFEWSAVSIFFGLMCEVILGQFPRSLKYVGIHVKCVMSGWDAFARCNNLCKLSLQDVEVGVRLDLSNCSSLEHVQLSRIHNLQTLVVPSTRMASRLKFLYVVWCTQLVEYQVLDQLVYLEFLKVMVPIRAPNLNGFNQLRVLDFSWSHNLEDMSEVGDLPALKSLNLSYCDHLRRLPNLSKSRNLEELDLSGCHTLELHEEDIQMLATLPLLHLVYFSISLNWGRIKLDPGRRKVLRYVGTEFDPPTSSLNCMEGEWEEKELGRPPIKLIDCDNGDLLKRFF